MREIITIIVCVVIFLIALQSGIVKTGLDYELIQKTSENLQLTNERLTREIKRMNNLTKSSDPISADQVVVLEQLEKAKTDLQMQLARELKTREIVMEEMSGELKFVVLDRALFELQSDTIKKEANGLLKKIAGVLGTFDGMEIRITGFTDNQPLSGSMVKKYSGLRAFSVARAIAIAEFFQTKGDIDPVQISVAGYGETRPIVPNDTEYHRTMNGRLEISLHPVDVAQLNKTREIYRTEALIPKQTKPTEKKVKKSRTEPMNDEPLGEEALDQGDDGNFGAGYDVPGNSGE